MNLCKDLNVVYEKVGRLTIYVDPRMELLAALQMNANYPFLSSYSFEYKDQMNDFFSNYNDHGAVRIFEDLFKKGFAYDAPPQLMLYLNKDLELTETIEDEMRPMITDQDYINFANAVKDYYEESNFKEFYTDHYDFYKKIVTNVAKKVKEYNIIEILEDFFGYSQNSYNVILSPCFIDGGYGINIKKEPDICDCYPVFGALDIKADMPVFYANVTYDGYTSDSIFTLLIWHEFAHTYVNPLTNHYIGEVNKYNKLFTPHAEKVSKQGYGNWESFVNEQIIEAIVSKLVNNEISKKDAEINKKFNREYRGFVYIDALFDQLEQYENNRDLYPTFDDFYRELIQVFKDLSNGNKS